MRTVITTIKKEDLDKVLNKYMIEARENNQDLTIRELSPSGEYFNLTLDFKLKLPFEVHGLQTPDKILEKIEELKGKKKYWNDLANASVGDREEDHKYERQTMFFDGAISSLEFALKKGEV